jgi:hypothetical protein
VLHANGTSACIAVHTEEHFHAIQTGWRCNYHGKDIQGRVTDRMSYQRYLGWFPWLSFSSTCKLSSTNCSVLIIIIGTLSSGASKIGSLVAEVLSGLKGNRRVLEELIAYFILKQHEFLFPNLFAICRDTFRYIQQMVCWEARAGRGVLCSTPLAQKWRSLSMFQLLRVYSLPR